METTKKIALPFPTDAKLVQWMVKLIRETLGDFSEVEIEYLLATSKSKLDTNLFNGINSIIDAWTTQIASDIRFATFQGFQANLEFFRHPVGNCFLNESTETYLRENVMRSLPARIQAQKIIDGIQSNFAGSASEVLDPIIEYYIYLETVCPKLSYYFGYLIGDKLLYALEPGYSRSISITIPYKILIHKLFGVYFDIL